ncbi:MAG: hypothetical protein QF615_10480, partial [Planctomycetota bacterium]|nr:hypothetical protein [Planctomycetota bacterium]
APYKGMSMERRAVALCQVLEPGTELERLVRIRAALELIGIRLLRLELAAGRSRCRRGPQG